MPSFIHPWGWCWQSCDCTDTPTLFSREGWSSSPCWTEYGVLKAQQFVSTRKTPPELLFFTPEALKKGVLLHRVCHILPQGSPRQKQNWLWTHPHGTGSFPLSWFKMLLLALPKLLTRTGERQRWLMLLLMSRQADRGCSWNSLVLTILRDIPDFTPGGNASPVGWTHPWSLPCGAGGYRKELCCGDLSSLIMVKSIFCDCCILCSRPSSISHSWLWNSAHSGASFPHSSKHFCSIDSCPSSKVLTQRYWEIKVRKVLPALAGLTFSKEPVSRGEGLCCDCACLMLQRQHLCILLGWIPLWWNMCFSCTYAHVLL